MEPLENRFLTAFPGIATNGCLTIEKRLAFEIEDPEGELPCRLVESGGQFRVMNPQAKSIHFLAVDFCFLGTSDKAKPDCALFDEKVLKLVELKDTKTNGRAIARKKAIVQLASYYSVMQDKGMDLSDYRVEAIIALSAQKGYPVFTSRNQEAALRFSIMGVHLLEGNETIF